MLSTNIFHLIFKAVHEAAVTVPALQAEKAETERGRMFQGYRSKEYITANTEAQVCTAAKSLLLHLTQ